MKSKDCYSRVRVSVRDALAMIAKDFVVFPMPNGGAEILDKQNNCVGYMAAKDFKRFSLELTRKIPGGDPSEPKSDHNVFCESCPHAELVPIGWARVFSDGSYDVFHDKPRESDSSDSKKWRVIQLYGESP